MIFSFSIFIMPRKCCVPGCGNPMAPFRIPTDKYLRKKWLERLTFMTENNVHKALICGVHFNTNCLDKSLTNRRRLHKFSLPSLNLPGIDPDVDWYLSKEERDEYYSDKALFVHKFVQMPLMEVHQNPPEEQQPWEEFQVSTGLENVSYSETPSSLQPQIELQNT